jgi:hypothetical protein
MKHTVLALNLGQLVKEIDLLVELDTWVGYEFWSVQVEAELGQVHELMSGYGIEFNFNLNGREMPCHSSTCGQSPAFSDDGTKYRSRIYENKIIVLGQSDV